MKADKNNLIFLPEGWENYIYWQTTDRKVLKKINKLIADIGKNGYLGIGKPEPLKHNWTGWWSRSIDEEHRLVYRIIDSMIEIAQCRGHY